jgi:hypothetical protein
MNKTTLLGIAMSFTLMACEIPGLPGDNTGGNTGNNTVTDTPSGKYIVKSDITETGDPDMYTLGCNEAGDAVAQVDPRLTVGKKIDNIQAVYTDGTGVGKVGYTTEVIALAADKISQRFTVTEASNYYDVAVGDTFDVTCTLTAQGPSCAQSGGAAKSMSVSTFDALVTPKSNILGMQQAFIKGNMHLNLKADTSSAPAAAGDHSKYEDCGFTAEPQTTVKATKG